LANGNISPCRFVRVDPTAGSANDEQVIQAGAASDRPVGVSGEWMRDAPGLIGSDNTLHAAAGNQCLVYQLGDDCLLESGGVINHGDLLASDSLGRGVIAGTGDVVGARALQSCAGAGIKIRVVVEPGTSGAAASGS
jgi:hypothetical protein